MDLGIRQALHASLKAVCQEVVRAGLEWPGDFDSWCRALLATPRAPPRLWSYYHDIVQSIVRDEVAPRPIIDRLMASLPASSAQGSEIVTISPDSLGDDAARYRAIVDSDPDHLLELQPATAADVSRLKRLAAESRAILLDVDPALLDEMDTLGHQIVLATNGSRSFGGAATVFLWGAVVLNPDRVPDRVTLVESLAHETAHALLFGMTRGADLTTNGPADRFASPLRPDPRPIEGIVHATYVLARMNYALERLLGSRLLTRDERASIEAKLAHNDASYDAGLATVDAHARFTIEGAAIFGSCRAFQERRRVHPR